jgi:membrane-bound serine protease (ClpP class)
MNAMKALRARLRRMAWITAWAIALLAMVAGAGLTQDRAGDKAKTVRAGKKARGEDRVLVLRLDGPISPITAEALENALTRAERERYQALVIEIDTPGGLESSMRDMVKKMLATPVPTIAWVTPSGAHAASAGVFIVMAADFAAMAPGTNIGAATPISLQGPMDSTLARKATNDASAFARSIATQRGRNAKWAEDAVRHAVSINEDEAVKINVVDTTAATLDEVLALAEGRSWRRGSAVGKLHVVGLPVDRIDVGFRQRLLALIADPNVAYILMLLGFYGVMFELQNPGAILPGVVGGICLILAFLALSVLPVNYAGIALILLAMVFFIAEIKVASHGILGAGGVIALILGSMILFHGTGVGRLSLVVVLVATAVTALFFLLVVGAGLRAQARRVTTGSAGMVGQRAVVIERLAPDGTVRLGDEIWKAVASTPVEAGNAVEITGIEGLTLRVRPMAKEA